MISFKEYGLTILVGCGMFLSSEAQTTIQFTSDQPDAPLVASAGDNQDYTGLATVILGGNPTAEGANGNYSYEWSPAEYLDDPNSPNPTILDLEGPTLFTVTVTADGALCEKSDDVFVDFTVGMGETEDQQVLAFPNPFVSQVELNSEKPISRIRLFDLAGNLLTDQLVNGLQRDFIDTEDLESGMYFFSIEFTGGSQSTLKLCKL